MSPELDEQLVATLRAQLTNERLKGTHVERVDLERGQDADGNPALFIRVTLDDPAAGAETWPSNDVRRLRELVREGVLRLLHDDLSWYVSFETATAGRDSE